MENQEELKDGVDEAVVTAETPNATAPQQGEAAPKQNVLLGAISYQTDEDYENFLDNLDINQAIFTLITSANYCQARGVFSVTESELIAKAIRTVKKNSKPQEAPSETKE